MSVAEDILRIASVFLLFFGYFFFYSSLFGSLSIVYFYLVVFHGTFCLSSVNGTDRAICMTTRQHLPSAHSTRLSSLAITKMTRYKLNIDVATCIARHRKFMTLVMVSLYQYLLCVPCCTQRYTYISFVVSSFQFE